MRMNKKGQGLSLNMVIVAAIALVVLVIIVAIFTGRISIWNKGVGACSTQQGVCKESCVDGEKSVIAKCPAEGENAAFKTCCVSLGA